MVTPMYVLVERKGGQIFGFGLTPEEATEDFRRGLVWYDGPPLDVHRCSPALYRQVQAHEHRGLFFPSCRINRQGVAVCPKTMPKVTDSRKD